MLLTLPGCLQSFDFAGADAAITKEHENGSMLIDQHSCARPAEARVTHLALDLSADFAAKSLRGTATFDVERSADAKELRLDTEGLKIEAVRDAAGGELAWKLEPRDPVIGSPLSIALGAQTRKVTITYSTGDAAGALQWLDPAQTAGKTRPFLLTQGQAILTRTWIPIQDSPGVRLTYEATIEVPEDLIAVMSALRVDPNGEPRAAGRRAYRFALDHAIPAYLIALAVGQLEFRSLGPRTGVFAEPKVIDAAAYELAETERMVEAAEALYGPYRWGRYDVLVLPPSFPFGGMENPCLTFATPTILAGDRSLVALIAHELAHSWSGNLVTNATWQDFWLNEGFTVYFENRIMEQVYGREYAEMQQVLGFQDLQSDIESFGATSKDTQLYTDLTGRNPDDAFSNIPYEKGALFLRALERKVGRARFDAFLRGYFDRYAFQSMTTAHFEKLLETALFPGDATAVSELKVKDWLYRPGLIEGAGPPRSARLAAVAAQIERFKAGASASSLDVKHWSTHEWLHFLRGMPTPLPAARLDELDATFGFSTTGNCEKRFEWLRVCIASDHRKADASLEQFLTMQGRRKFLKPLYTDLLGKPWGVEVARAIYQKARPGYHPVSTNTIDKLMSQVGG